MRSYTSHMSRTSRGRIVLLCGALVTLGILSGCGNGKGASATPTQVTAAYVCPAGEHSMGIPANAVVANEQSPGHTATVNPGQVVVIELPPQMRWSYDPAASHTSNLTTRQPTGSLDSAVGVCFWQWQAQSTGTSTLVFNGQPNCSASQQVCPPTGGGSSPASGGTSSGTGTGANAGSGGTSTGGTSTGGTSTGGTSPGSTAAPNSTTKITFKVDVR